MSQCNINQTNQINQLTQQLTQVQNKLKQSGQTNKFNSFISKASDAIMCNSECQKKRQSDLLKQQFVDSQSNLAFAPGKVNVAEKNYVSFTEGTPAYNELIDKRLYSEAQKIADTFTTNFNTTSQSISSQINNYDSLLLNYKNVLDLYIKYKEENVKLFEQLKEDTNDVLTNDRKTYYEDQQIDSLKFYYYYFLLTAYVICVICYVIFSFVRPSETSFLVRFAIFVGLVILPFISSLILSNIMNLLYNAYNLLPKNVYKEKNY
jgi:predicted DNA-binding protein YlxM (UPF0122 family)